MEAKKEQTRTIAQRLHDSFLIQDSVEDMLLGLFEKYEPEVYEKIDFTIGSDDYDNSIEIYFNTPMPYPWEPCHALRKEIHAWGFSTVYWNFKADKDLGEYEEVRGYEPRHVRDSKQWIPTKYGYVDSRFNESEWTVYTEQLKAKQPAIA
ncbi:hypothetical protein [Spirosoma sp. KUDC1026]|uniref:hypothetical protein n=1 Tax=Spirosoma sp. KUDC1026 TaxID=2745947 RepID=UPI00159BA632|nr:hypothetical protein [Spirosoma sp. KUDC1026]QKZ15175.1 hypothetical protein HU175_22140 [Spirosoma sp. KUDC1026]